MYVDRYICIYHTLYGIHALYIDYSIDGKPLTILTLTTGHLRSIRDICSIILSNFPFLFIFAQNTPLSSSIHRIKSRLAHSITDIRLIFIQPKRCLRHNQAHLTFDVVEMTWNPMETTRRWPVTRLNKTHSLSAYRT